MWQKPRERRVPSTASALSQRQAWLWACGSLTQPQPAAGHTWGNTEAYPRASQAAKPPGGCKLEFTLFSFQEARAPNSKGGT